jgi:hypothetical protein
MEALPNVDVQTVMSQAFEVAYHSGARQISVYTRLLLIPHCSTLGENAFITEI